MKTLIRLGRCPGWSESSLVAQSLCWFCHVATHMYKRWSYKWFTSSIVSLILVQPKIWNHEVYVMNYRLVYITWPGSSVGCTSDWYSDCRGFDPTIRRHSFVGIGHEIISTAIFLFTLIQVGHLSVGISKFSEIKKKNRNGQMIKSKSCCYYPKVQTVCFTIQ